MEERLPTADHSLPRLPPLSETYVVQIPRDQIYRIPPPENALIVEYHVRNAPQKQKKCGGTSPVFWAFLTLAVLAAASGIVILAIRATLYNPKSPEFSVARIRAKNLDQLLHPNKGHSRNQPPEYDIALRSHNPNSRMSVSYKGAGKVSLVFKNKKLGQVGFPSGIEEEPQSSIDIPLMIRSSGSPALTAEIKKSLNDTKEKSLSLKAHVPIEIKSWVRNVEKDVVITCDFQVKNSLTNKPKISSQECFTDF